MAIIFANDARWDFDRDCVKFHADDDGRLVLCLVSLEALQDHFGGSHSSDAAVRTYADNRAEIEQKAREKIAANAGAGSILLTSSDF
ncbi:DUF1488 domain-containing protein [Pandoraea sputorum]|uniref:DUF1488 domain-containing protein n=1 Tax=Pandoraea sputorum TaxID=93222 RepID=UPI002F40CB5D